MMIVIYWAWSVWNWLKNLCQQQKIEFIQVDDKNPFDEKILKSAEKIVVSPGLAFKSHRIYKTYREKIIGEYDFCYQIIKQKWLEKSFELIGVTWTDWKSTTCYLIFQALEKLKSEKKLDADIYLWGNYEPAFSQVLFDIFSQEKVCEKNILILETSSFAWFNIKTIIFENSIFTNFATDHLNWHNDMQEYFEAKKNIFKNTKNACIIWEDVFEKDKNFFSSKNYFLIDWKQNFENNALRWVHNQKNLQSVFLLLKAMGFWPDDYLKNILNSLSWLEHRIQYIATINSIEFYDDWKSTSSQSLGAGLSAFDSDVCLIAGWSDKWDMFSHLSEEFEKKVKVWVFLGQTSNQFKEIFDSRNIPNILAQNMEDAVKIAFEQAKSLWCKYILFSPGCASFDMFKNRLDRVEQYRNAVEQVKNNLKK